MKYDINYFNKLYFCQYRKIKNKYLERIINTVTGRSWFRFRNIEIISRVRTINPQIFGIIIDRIWLNKSLYIIFIYLGFNISVQWKQTKSQEFRSFCFVKFYTDGYWFRWYAFVTNNRNIYDVDMWRKFW